MKLDKFLCLKCFGRSVAANSCAFQTTKLLLPSLHDTTESVAGSSTIAYSFLRNGGNGFVVVDSSSLVFSILREIASEVLGFRSYLKGKSDRRKLPRVFTSYDNIYYFFFFFLINSLLFTWGKGFSPVATAMLFRLLCHGLFQEATLIPFMPSLLT
jgi:hypothetical protein